MLRWRRCTGTDDHAALASLLEKPLQSSWFAADDSQRFNVFGVVLFLPFLGRFAERVVAWADDPGIAVAWAQLIFKSVMILAVLLLLWIFQRRLVRFNAGEVPTDLSVGKARA